ncbi:MAG: septum formation protein Maf [Tissierellia bacterium]|jgi:septum formation protein|nr:septum formation protein Maf [Tissierellia bacterium]
MNIVLASKSERRKEILEKYFHNIIIVDSHSNEFYNLDFDLYTNIMSISREKINEIKFKYKNSIVLGADTVVVLENEILGKASDINEARSFLKKLSNKEHKVITAFSICCIDRGIEVCDYVESKVQFRRLEDNLIEEYLNTNEWTDKAGAYGIQGKASIFVESITGDYLSIVGLPISKILTYLIDYFDFNIMRLDNEL